MSLILIKENEIKAQRERLKKENYYDDSWSQQFELVASYINDLSGSDKKILEVGCGIGYLSTLLEGEYAGIDPILHEDCIEGFDFKIGFGEDVPHPDNSFDLILIKDSVNYFADLSLFAKEAVRLLKEDGIVLVSEYVGPKYNPIKQSFKNLIKRYLHIGVKNWNKTYLSYYTSIDIIRVFMRCGFRAEYRYPREDSRYYLILRKSRVGR